MTTLFFRILIVLSFLNISVNLFAQSQDCLVHGTFLWGKIPCKTETFQLIFEDEFNGNMLNRDYWEIAYPWGETQVDHNELQVYQEDNISVNGGTLSLTAEYDPGYRRAVSWEPDGKILADGYPNFRNFDYTSGMILSKFKFYHGKYEIRCRMPNGTGRWPAFWLYGGVRWNEIDIFDNYHGNSSFITSVGHDFDGDGDSEGCPKEFSDVPDFSQWHVISLIFDIYEISWFVDYQHVRTVPRFRTWADGEAITCNANIARGTYGEQKAWPLEPMVLIANLAVRGAEDAPNGDVPFPSTLEIDYIKAYERVECCGDSTFTENSDLYLAANNIYNYRCGKNLTIDGNIYLPTRRTLGMAASESITILPGYETANLSLFDASITQVPCNSPNKKAASQTSFASEAELKDEIRIYPNPANNILHLSREGEGSIGNIKVYDLRGKLIGIHTVQNVEYDLDISTFAKGLYYLEVEKAMYKFTKL